MPQFKDIWTYFSNFGFDGQKCTHVYTFAVVMDFFTNIRWSKCWKNLLREHLVQNFVHPKKHASLVGAGSLIRQFVYKAIALTVLDIMKSRYCSREGISPSIHEMWRVDLPYGTWAITGFENKKQDIYVS